MFFNYFIPTRIMFGKGQLSHLHECVPPGDKALVVISTGKSTRKNGYLNRLIEELKLAGVDYVVYDKIQPNPTKTSIMDGAAVARESSCDFVIGLGGGSVMDASKSIAIMATNDGDYWDYVFGGSGKGKPIKNTPLPVVAISTTAGTGSETNPWTVITKEETNEKIGFGYDRTFPVLALVDPDLMLSVPPLLTAYQGFDALFHATEAYISKSANLNRPGLTHTNQPPQKPGRFIFSCDTIARTQYPKLCIFSFLTVNIVQVWWFFSAIAKKSLQTGFAATFPPERQKRKRKTEKQKICGFIGMAYSYRWVSEAIMYSCPFERE